MISDIDDKVYEMAMLRALGLRSASLAIMIILQSMVFSIPGLAVGLIVSSIFNIVIRYFVFSFTVSSTSYFLATLSLILGLVVGIVMPFVTNFFTVKRAMQKQIRDALDIFHNSINDTMVNIRRLESFGVSPFTLGLGILLVVFGIMTYYLAPASFLFKRMDIFFFIINLILIGMILGMSLICVLIFPYIQNALIH